MVGCLPAKGKPLPTGAVFLESNMRGCPARKGTPAHGLPRSAGAGAPEAQLESPFGYVVFMFIYSKLERISNFYFSHVLTV